MTDKTPARQESSESQSRESLVLPVPLFRVLQKEYAQMGKGALADPPSWLLLEDHLVGAADKLPRELWQLAQVDHSAGASSLIAALNHLLQNKDRLFKQSVNKGLNVLNNLQLVGEDRTRINRLLLEAAFPEHVRSIDIIHLKAHYDRIHQEQKGLSALCISGGGIRSATFGLGILQGLAKNKILTGFDYLSTVSGGGYIGGWLSSWIQRKGSANVVQEELGNQRAVSPKDPEPEPVRALRTYSNYLTPALGFLSADTWSLAGIYLCNLFLNWMVFIPILLAIFALPRLGLAILHMDPKGTLPLWVLGIGFGAGVWGLTYSMIYRPSNVKRRPDRKGEKDTRPSQTHFLKWCLTPLWLCAVCTSTFWIWWNGEDYVNQGWLAKVWLGWFYVAFGAGLHIISWIISRFRIRKVFLWEIVVVLATGAIGGFFLWGLSEFASQYAYFHEDEHSRGVNADVVSESIYVCLAAPAFFGAFLLSATLFTGFTSWFTSDGDREWWARMGAWLLLTSVCWAGFGVLTLLGPLLLFGAKAIITSLGSLSGLWTLLAARGSDTPARKGADARAGPSSSVLQLGMAVTTPLFIGFLVMSLSMVSGWLIYGLSQCGVKGWAPFAQEWDGGPLKFIFNEYGYFLELHAPTQSLVIAFILLAAGIGALLSRIIDVNKFSIHALYRNRLVRAYLGASNSHRRPNPFSGFDPEDDLPISDLGHQKPLHIVNMALNLVGGDNLAWQERMAESFTASALYCGSTRLGYRSSKSYGKQRAEKVRRDARVGRGEGDQGKYEGVGLGTVVAISGAAASPNMGYNSSPVVAALMTFFNIRLGWWLGNSGPAGQTTYHDPAPDWGMWYMAKEAFGLTNDTSRYVYLSDGGHFENLGLYEMIQRRVRLIVVSDAGCDPTCNLEDLGNAIRKIRIDQGVEINLTQFGIYSRDDENGTKVGKYCAVGDIDYSPVDGHPGGKAPKGVLIYIKPALLGNEPKDVYNYKEACPQFPHESTADQWFSESQFESYRALGFHIIDSIVKTAPEVTIPDLCGHPELNQFAAKSVQYVKLSVPSWKCD